MDRRKLILATGAALPLAFAGRFVHAQGRRFKVGVSLPEAQNPFYIAMGRSIVQAFGAQQMDVTLLSANADVNEQVNNINDLVVARVDALLLSPLNTEGPAPAVQKAKAAGIPIFMVARTLDDKYSSLWESFIGIDFKQVGAAKGKWAVDSLKPGKVAMLLGPAGALVMVDQERSFRAVVEPAGFRVAFSQNSTQTRENGLKLAEDALVAHRDLVCIYASNDDLALGAAQAVKAAGLTGKVAVTGLNGSPPALAAVYNGDMASSVLLDPVGWGKLAADTVAEFLKNKKVPQRFVSLQFSMVTQQNAYDLIPPPLRERLGVKPR
ncbi:MAG: ABC transporter substrate-binding protein [Betaproteobacteria bacterium]